MKLVISNLNLTIMATLLDNKKPKLGLIEIPKFIFKKFYY
jgi:hypothetical protein